MTEEALKSLKRAIVETAEACEHAKRDGAFAQEAFEHLGYLLRALPSWLTQPNFIAGAWNNLTDPELLSKQSNKVLDLQMQLTNERTAAHCEILALKIKYDEAVKLANKLVDADREARAVLAKVLDREMAEVKLSDVNDLVLEIAAESARSEAAETARDNAMLRSYALENALRECLNVCGQAVSASSPAEAQLVLAQRVRKVVVGIIVGTKNEQT